MNADSFDFAKMAGGAFMCHLCHTFLYADGENLEKLNAAFPEVAAMYAAMKDGSGVQE